VVWPQAGELIQVSGPTADTSHVKRRLALSWLLPAVVLLTAALGLAGMRGPGRPVVGFEVSDDEPVPASCEPGGDAPVVGPSAGPTDDPTCQPTGDPTDDPIDDPTDGEDGEEPDPVRVAACEEAAGRSSEPSEEKLTGLDRAIDRVLANCIKNPQAPGLVNALERLSENHERQEGREEAREAQKAAREAAREARKAAKQGGHGGPPDHAGGPPDQAGGGPPSHSNAGGKGNPH
jgi:PT repeat-containing protein